MLRNSFLLAGLAASVLGIATIGCGDDTNAGGASSTAGAQPPKPTEGAPAADGSGKNLGLSKLYIGTTNRAGAESANAWQDYGYDLDGQVTTTDYTKHCKPAAGASPADAFKDGSDGRDNAFGKSLLPIIKSAAMGTDLQAQVNKALDDGTFTIIVDMSNIGDGKDYSKVTSFLLAGKNKHDGNTWDLVPELLNGTTPDSSQVKFPDSYVTNNTWVSGTKGTVKLNLSIAGFDIALNIASAVITMDLDAAHSGATNGTIAGVLDTEDFISQLKKVVGAFDTSLCTGSTVDSILNRIRQASDIMNNGTQDASATCNGISIGIGFDATAVQLGVVAPPAQPQPDPCLATSSSSSSSAASGSGSSGSGG